VWGALGGSHPWIDMDALSQSTLENMMIFVYKNVLALEGTEKVGSKQCVALLQTYVAGIGNHRQWKEGDLVMGNKEIEPGTAIATFVNGEYPSLPHGNHVAFFVSHGCGGFFVMDQWADDEEKPLVSQRFIRTGGKKKNSKGWWPNGGQNAYAYSIIER
jgi:hypothetical protein